MRRVKKIRIALAFLIPLFIMVLAQKIYFIFFFLPERIDVWNLETAKSWSWINEFWLYWSRPGGYILGGLPIVYGLVGIGFLWWSGWLDKETDADSASNTANTNEEPEDLC